MEEHEDNQFCFQDRNSSCRKTLISTSIYITLYFFFLAISAVTVFLNLLVIVSISHFKQLHTPTNLLILSLSVSDFLVGLIVIPGITVGMMEACWVLGEYLCMLLFSSTILCSTSSLGNLILISIDRYVAVCDPLKYNSKITKWRITSCIFITWFCCIINVATVVKTHVNVQVPSGCFEECFFDRGDFLVKIIDVVISLILPCFIILPLYVKIFVVARSQARKFRSRGAATLSGVEIVQASTSERKAAKTLGIIVFNYLMCWNPLLYVFFAVFPGSNLALNIITFLPLVNSFINPIIYAFFYPWFKMTLKHLLFLKVSHQ